MESRDGFRRRTAIAVHEEKHPSQPKKIDISAFPHKIPKPSLPKFCKIKPPTLYKRRSDQSFLKVVDELKERKGTFVRMGFRSYEKKQNRKVLGDVLGLDTNRTKGTMYLGELWSNRQHARFLKENRIYMTKMKLIDKFQDIRNDYEEAEKNFSQMEIEDINSCRSLADMPDALASISIQSRRAPRKYRIVQNLQEIKSSLKQLRKKSSVQTLMSEVRYLERCQDRMDQVERHYFLKMLELQ